MLALTRAMVAAKRGGRVDDMNRINRALSVLLTVDEPEEESSRIVSRHGPAGTKIGLGVR